MKLTYYDYWDFINDGKPENMWIPTPSMRDELYDDYRWDGDENYLEILEYDTSDETFEIEFYDDDGDPVREWFNFRDLELDKSYKRTIDIYEGCQLILRDIKCEFYDEDWDYDIDDIDKAILSRIDEDKKHAYIDIYFKNGVVTEDYYVGIPLIIGVKSVSDIELYRLDNEETK